MDRCRAGGVTGPIRVRASILGHQKAGHYGMASRRLGPVDRCGPLDRHVAAWASVWPTAWRGPAMRGVDRRRGGPALDGRRGMPGPDAWIGRTGGRGVSVARTGDDRHMVLRAGTWSLGADTWSLETGGLDRDRRVGLGTVRLGWGLGPGRYEGRQGLTTLVGQDDTRSVICPTKTSLGLHGVSMQMHSSILKLIRTFSIYLL